jgi:hypothetical protein
VGIGEGSRARAWWSEGRAAHYAGYRPLYLVAKAAYRMRDELSAAALVGGYVSAKLHHTRSISDPTVRDAIRERQRLRDLGREFYKVVRHR